MVNCDSLQLYRFFDIGSAKLPVEARRGIPHHLIDIVDPDEIFTAGEYARAGRDVLLSVSQQGRLPVVAGGTGFYLRALLDGLFPGPSRDERLRERLAERQNKTPGSLHRLLGRLDRDAAARIHANDIPKIIRALEVRLLTRRPVSAWFHEKRDALKGYHALKIGLSPTREALYKRLDLRCEQMFASGLVEEVRRILAMGFSPDVKPFESHGYRQALQLLKGELTEKEALFYAQRNTRQYAKRQMTWFRQEKDVEWFSGFGDDAGIQRAVLRRVQEYLKLKITSR